MNRFFIVITLIIVAVFAKIFYDDIYIYQGENVDTTLKILKMNQNYIQKSAIHLNMNPRIIASIIYAERRLNINIIDRYENLLGHLGLDTSIGIAQIRVSTASWIINSSVDTSSAFCVPQKYWGFVPQAKTTEEILGILQNDSLNIVLASLYVKQMMTYWGKYKYPINDCVDILATLYSKGIYIKGTNTIIVPHKNPVSNKMGKVAKAFYNSKYLSFIY